jgi:hypothetical protein
MATFDFYVDEKCTIWQRVFFEVEAETEEEAKKKAVKLFHRGEYDNGSSDCETIYDTMEHIVSPKDNGGEATLELYTNFGRDELLTDNKNLD